MKKLIQKTVTRVAVETRRFKVRVSYTTVLGYNIIGYGKDMADAIEQCQKVLLSGDRAMVESRVVEGHVLTGSGPSYGVVISAGKRVKVVAEEGL